MLHGEGAQHHLPPCLCAGQEGLLCVVITAVGDGYGLVQVLGCIEHLDVRTGDIQQEGEGILEGRLTSCVQEVDEGVIIQLNSLSIPSHFLKQLGMLCVEYSDRAGLWNRVQICAWGR